MSDEKVPVGDASHLIDEPKPYKTIEKTMVPVTVQVGDDKNGPVEVKGEMKGTVERVVTKEEIAEQAKRIKEPCTKCRYFYFPKEDSQEYKEIKAVCSAVLTQLPDWMRANFQGYQNPNEWGVCKKRNGMIHVIGNTCEFFKPKGIFGAFGLHTAKDKRDP